MHKHNNCTQKLSLCIYCSLFLTKVPKGKCLRQILYIKPTTTLHNQWMHKENFHCSVLLLSLVVLGQQVPLLSIIACERSERADLVVSRARIFYIISHNRSLLHCIP